MTGLNQDLALPCLVEVAEIISCLLVEVAEEEEDEVAEEEEEEEEWVGCEGREIPEGSITLALCFDARTLVNIVQRCKIKKGNFSKHL